MGYGLTLLLMVVGAWIGVRIAVWNADKRRHEFFSEMIRRQQEMGPLTMDVWSKATLLSAGLGARLAIARFWRLR